MSSPPSVAPSPASPSTLFQPLHLRSLAIANRIVVSPMCQYSATDGSASDWHVIHLGQLALGGAGMLFLEATGITAEGRITPSCLGLYSDDNERALARVVETVRRYSNIPLCIQLSHAGRKGSSAEPWNGGALLPASRGGWTTVAPSPIPQLDGETPPRALTRNELRGLCEAFATAARRAARIGFDAVEIHAAHGYLLHEFLSPLANHRDDDCGGSLENRMRFPLEVFDAVRAAFPAERPVGVRVSATDWIEGGWDLDQTLQFARALKARGCDWIDVSSGGISPLQKIAAGPGYQVPFARAIRAETGITTIAVGLITEPKQAEQIIASGDADMVALARGMLWNPHWAWQAAADLGGSVSAPKQYWRSPPHGARGVFGSTTTGQR